MYHFITIVWEYQFLQIIANTCVLIIVLPCIFLNTEYILICLFAIYVSSLVKCLLKYLSILFIDYMLLYYWVLKFFMLDASVYQIYDWQSFSQSVSVFSFHSFSVFWRADTFNFDEVRHKFSVFWIVFLSYLINTFPTHDHKYFYVLF